MIPCNTPDVTFPICTPTLDVSGVKLFYFLGFGFLSPCVVVVVMHLISCHHVHCICIRVRLMHPSIFPVVRFAIRRSYLPRCTPFVFFRVRVSNIHGMDRGLSGGLGIPPVKFRSIWRAFGTPTVNRASAKSICVCSKPPLKTSPKPNKLSSML